MSSPTSPEPDDTAVEVGGVSVRTVGGSLLAARQSVLDAAGVMKAVADAGVDLDDVFRVLEEEGVKKFVDSWDELTESVRTQLEDKK